MAIIAQSVARMLRSKIPGVFNRSEIIAAWLIQVVFDAWVPFVAYSITGYSLWLYAGYTVAGLLTLEGLFVLLAIRVRPLVSSNLDTAPTRGPPEVLSSSTVDSQVFENTTIRPITEVEYDPVRVKEIWRVVLALLVVSALFHEAVTYSLISLSGNLIAITTTLGLIGLVLAALLNS